MNKQQERMPAFPQAVIDFWHTSFFRGVTFYSNEIFSIIINPELSEDNRVMILKLEQGKTMAVLTPKIAAKSGLRATRCYSETNFRRQLQDCGIHLHKAEALFYFTEAEKEKLLETDLASNLRRLTEQDHELFAQFESSSLEQDLDDAFVELDHWAVFGSLEQNRLVSAASMYPWMGKANLADIGVLTLAPFRGQGHGRSVVRSIAQYACQQGAQPQFRCRLDQQESIALAQAAGLTLFGTWEVISPDSNEWELE